MLKEQSIEESNLVIQDLAKFQADYEKLLDIDKQKKFLKPAKSTETKAMKLAGFNNAIVNLKETDKENFQFQKNLRTVEKYRKMGVQVYNTEALYYVQCKYGLWRGNPDKYNGLIPSDLGKKILEFNNISKKIHESNRLIPKNKKIGDFNVGRFAPMSFSNEKRYNKDFVLIAPKNCFEEPIDLDPMLFCEIEEGYYALVHKWGDDIGKVRAFWQSKVSYIRHVFFGIGWVANILPSFVVSIFTNMYFASLYRSGEIVEGMMANFLLFRNDHRVLFFFGIAWMVSIVIFKIFKKIIYQHYGEKMRMKDRATDSDPMLF